MLRADVIEGNLRKVINGKDMSYKQFAEFIEMNPSALRGIMNGLSRPRLDTMIKISNKTGVSIDSLCTEGGVE